VGLQILSSYAEGTDFGAYRVLFASSNLQEAEVLKGLIWLNANQGVAG